MTKQATFNRVARHLLRQLRRATDRHRVCVLHASGGLRCAAGVLVTRKDYDQKWEAWPVVNPNSKSRLCLYFASEWPRPPARPRPTIGPRQHPSETRGLGQGTPRRGEETRPQRCDCRRVRRRDSKRRCIVSRFAGLTDVWSMLRLLERESAS